MVENPVPTSIRIGRQQFKFQEIHNMFAETKYGRKLQSNVRFHPFKPESMPNTEWQSLLGMDVNNLDHCLLSYVLTRSFLTSCQNFPQVWVGPLNKDAVFSRSDQERLLFTATVHDWAESIVGDIPYNQKTDADEAKELVILEGLIQAILGNRRTNGDLKSLTEDVLETLKDKQSKTGKAFNAIERAGYVRTGIRAWQQIDRVDDPLADNFYHLGKRVITANTSHLRSYAQIYPPMMTFLNHHALTINAIIAA